MDNKLKGSIILSLIVVATLPLTIKLAQGQTNSTAITRAALIPRTNGEAALGEAFPSAPGAWSRVFENDPNVVGSWKTVDFVRKQEDFIPGKTGWTGGFAFDRLNFLADGRTSGPWIWTKGYLWHPGDKAEGKYEIKDLRGTQYLFMEWMSGDVLIRGQKPSYYVFQRE